MILHRSIFSLDFYFPHAIIFLGGYSSVGRAIRSQRIGHEFESRYLHFGSIAQLG